MPYYIKKVKDGYKVCKKDNSKCFSLSPLTKEKAIKQMKAIGMMSHKGSGLCCSKPSRVEPQLEENNSMITPKEPTIINSLNENKSQDEDEIDFALKEYEEEKRKKIGNGIQTFKNKLKNIGVSLASYLNIAKKNAEKNGYDKNLLTLSKKKGKKLNYNGIDFGSSDNNDFIIYSLLAKKNKITKKEAEKHRELYLSRAENIKGDWKNNKESPNFLAIKIIWNG